MENQVALHNNKNEKEFRIQSIKTQCIVFGLYRTLHKIESAIESVIKPIQNGHFRCCSRMGGKKVSSP